MPVRVVDIALTPKFFCAVNYLINNVMAVNEGAIQKRSVYIADGKFSDNAPDPQATIVDGDGCFLLPGIIDTHVHFREPGMTEKADMSTESRAAIAGGVTSVIDMPNTMPQTTTLEALEAKERLASQKCAVNYGFMLGATNDNVDALLSIPLSRYAAIKLFMGSSTGNMLVDDIQRLEHLFANAKKLIVAHCEDENVVQSNMAAFKAQYKGTDGETAVLHPQIRNTEACFLSTYKAIALARKYNTRLHIAHVSTATELDLLSNQSLTEKNVTAEVTPNHLWFDSRDYAMLGNRIKCNPAIKSNDDRMALWAALYDGRLDTIATDHAPHTLESKQRPYFEAPSGIPSIQHSLQMMMEPFFNSCTTQSEREELVKNWLPLIVEKMCHNPARIFGIEKRGFIRHGFWADAVLVRPNVADEVTKDSLLYKCGWSPLEGQVLHSRIEQTFINGEPAALSRSMPLVFS